MGVSVRKIKDLHNHIKKEIAIAQAAYKKAADTKRLPAPPYKVGNYVFLNMKNIKTTAPTPKMGKKHTGPYKITRIINANAVKINLPNLFGTTHDVFNVSLFEPAPPSTILGQTQNPPEIITIEGKQKYKVSRILDSRYKGNKLQYRFKWVGYKDQDSENLKWYPAANANHAPELIADFHGRNPHLPGPGD